MDRLFLSVTLSTLAALSACETAPSSPRESVAAKLSDSGREAFQMLLAAERFTDDAIYAGGVTPNEVIALRKLLKDPNAGAALEELERRETMPGHLFALCGLYYVDPSVFREQIETYRDKREIVFFQSGCEGIHDQPVAGLVDRGDGQAVRLVPGQTNREWLKAHVGSYRYDILGGGWPNLFRDGGWGEVRDEDYSPVGE